ncbi:hypothetical protein ACRZ5S_22825 (plasmid) [Vibrio scophthalmi]|uniref:hypothetical protein n=1 Tax=Vibrio scophthalmi TaxID=45658 RepID=UPI003EBA9DFF
MTMTELETICMINASGTFLAEHLTVELWCGDKDELYEFIQSHKLNLLEDNTAEEIVQMIINQADSQMLFLNTNISKLLQQKIDIEDLDVISNAVTADIWYDAEAMSDSESVKVIEDTQNAMASVSSILHELIVSDAPAA